METDYRMARIVDVFSGEQLDGVPYLVKPKKRYYEKEYALMFLLDLERLAKDRNFSFREIRVLLFMISKVGLKNQIILEQKEIAQELGIHPTTVCKIIAMLIKNGYIEKVKKRGPLYRLNPDFGWRGTGKDFQLEMERRRLEKRA
jgi:Firmicute plasmid replication protein (RepL)